MRKIIAVLFAAFLLWSCGNRDKFTVECRVNGIGEETVEMIYFDGEGVKRVSLEAKGNVLKGTGASEEMTLVELRRSNGELLARFLAANGDKIKVTTAIGAAIDAVATGNADTDSLVAFTKANRADILRGGSHASDAAIERAIATHADQAWVTAALMLYYRLASNPQTADSLFNSISPEARPSTLVEGFSAVLGAYRADRIGAMGLMPVSTIGKDGEMMSVMFNAKPRVVTFFTGGRRPDSVGKALSKLTKNMSADSLRIYEISLRGDSAQWARTVRGDTVGWKQGWLPGGAGNPSLSQIGIPQTPYFIVTDAFGRPLYRGASVSSMVSAVTRTDKN